MYSAYKLNKQGDNIETLRTSFPNWNQSVAPCLFLTVIFWNSQEAGKVVWYSYLFKNFPQFVVVTLSLKTREARSKSINIFKVFKLKTKVLLNKEFYIQ